VSIGCPGNEIAGVIARSRHWELVECQSFLQANAFLASGLQGTVLIVNGPESLQARGLLSLATQAALKSPFLSLGFLYGRSPQQLQESGQRLLCGTSASSSHGVQRVFSMMQDAYPLWGARLLNVKDSKEKALRLLKEPSDLDFYVGHSNGCDMGLGGLVLCRRGSVDCIPPDELRVMPCFHGSPCTRALSGKGDPASADHVGAQRVVCASCWGATLGPTHFAPEYSFGEGLLVHSGVNILLTTVRVSSFSANELSLIYYMANAGIPFGLIANRINQLRLKTKRTAEWICFGDPTNAMTGQIHDLETELRAGTMNTSILMEVPLARACDVGCRRPIGCDEPILISEKENGTLTAAFDPEGTLYATLPSGWSGSQLVYRVLSRRELVNASRGARQLLADLEFIEAYLGGVLRDRPTELVLQAQDALGALKRILMAWPLESLKQGDVINREWLDEAWKALNRGVFRLAESLLNIAVVFMQRLGCMQFRAWSWAFHETKVDETVVICRYCGSPVDEIVHEGHLRTQTRRIGFCDACGFLYDGNPKMGRWLLLEEPIQPGESVIMEIPVRNPYPIAVPVSAVGNIDLHETAASRFARIPSVVLEGHRRQTLKFELEYPNELYSGITFVGATVIIGGQVNFYARPMRALGRKRP
jgi:hypothetical protein